MRGIFPELNLRLAAAFVRVPVDRIDDEINASLERICLTFDLDRSTIAEFDARTGWVTFTHGWARKPAVILTRALDANALLPWTIAEMLAGKTVVMPSPDNLPEDAAIDRKSFQRYGTKSNVMVPIKVGGALVAAMSFATFRYARPWPPELVRDLETLAETFGHALSRKRAEIETARLRTELMHVSRVATLGGLVAAITHELTQPISAVGMNAETALAMLEVPQPDLNKLRQAIASIVEDNERSAAIVKRLRPLFQREPNAKSEVDVDAALKDVSKILKTDAQSRRIRFAVDIRQPLPRISGDRIQIQQAILNLVLNAFDAVAETKGTSRQVVLEAARETGDQVKITVRDSGKGIETKLLDTIFEPFFTTKTTGMGMGLFIARSVIEAHGGRISVSSQTKRGTVFEIDLPCTGIALPLTKSLVAL